MIQNSSDISERNTVKHLFLCCLQSVAAHIVAPRDHFVQRLSVRLSVRLFCSHTFLVVTRRNVLQATHAFHGMLPFLFLFCMPYFGEAGNIYIIKVTLFSCMCDLSNLLKNKVLSNKCFTVVVKATEMNIPQTHG